MPFDQSTITSVAPPVVRGSQVYLSWSTTSPAGTWWQLYLNGSFAWRGQRTSAYLPLPSGPLHIDIGAVGTGQEQTDFSRSIPYGSMGHGLGGYGTTASLPSAPARRAVLSWLGGTFQAADLAGFHIYGSAAANGPISYTNPIAAVTAYPAGIMTDGYGLGSYSSGGWGTIAGTYTWTSGPLDAGVWSYAVTPFDSAGNEGVAQTTTVVIAAPPRAPAATASGTTVTRLSWTDKGYGFGGYGYGAEPLYGGGGYGYGLGLYGAGPYGGGLPYGEFCALLSWQPSPA
jgi:hypothetical protein